MSPLQVYLSGLSSSRGHGASFALALFLLTSNTAFAATTSGAWDWESGPVNSSTDLHSAAMTQDTTGRPVIVYGYYWQNGSFNGSGVYMDTRTGVDSWNSKGLIYKDWTTTLGKRVLAGLHPGGQPCGAYLDGNSGELSYHCPALDSLPAISGQIAPLANGPLAMDIDNAGVVHSVYSDGTYLRYRRGEGAAEILELAGFIDLSASIAVDNNGVPHVAYFADYGNGGRELRYAYRTPLGWAGTIIDASVYGPYNDYGTPGYNDLDMELDSQGSPHIAYHRAGYEEVYLAKQVAGQWQNEFVGYGGPAVALAFDSADQTHFAWDFGGILVYKMIDKHGSYPYELVEFPNANISPILGFGLEVDTQGRAHIMSLHNQNALFYLRRNAIQMRELVSDVPVENLKNTAGNDYIFTIDVPVNTARLLVSTHDGAGELDLYVRRDAPPTTTAYDCASTGSTYHEHCDFDLPQSGTYYVMLRTDTDYKWMTLAANVVPFKPLANGERAVFGEMKRGDQRYYKADLSNLSPTYLTVDTSGSAVGDLALYVANNRLPTPEDYDCLSNANNGVSGAGPTEHCDMTFGGGPGPNPYYILVDAIETTPQHQIVANHTEQTPRTLLSGFTVFQIQGTWGQQQYFEIDVPAGTKSLQVTANNAYLADLYVKQDTKPMTNRFDCAREGSSSYTKECILDFGTGLSGTHKFYIMLRGTEDFVDVSLSARIIN